MFRAAAAQPRGHTCCAVYRALPTFPGYCPFEKHPKSGLSLSHIPTELRAAGDQTVEMSSQQFSRSGAPPAGLGQAPPPISTSGSTGLINPTTTVSDESNRESEVAPREHMGPGGSLQSREEKQEPVVVRPYPQVQMLAQHHTVQSGAAVTVTAPPAHLTPAVPLSFSEGLMKPPMKPPMPSRPIAPAPPSTMSAPTKVPGQVTVTMENSIPQASAIPVATISGQQGHASNLHHIMATNVQMSIIRSSAPGPPLHIGASHLPRGAAAAAVMSSSKVTTVLRPASQLPNAATAQPAVQHIIHQPIQSRPPVTTSSTIPPAVIATVSATRAQSPVITTTAAHATESTLSRPTLSIQQHPPSAAISIQRPAQPRDTATRITLPSHPAIGTPKQQLHTMAQKTIFSTGTPVAAATVAPILATNTIASATTAGSVSHTQAPTSTIVTMTMPSHSSHATAVTTSNIPVAKVVPQQITHTSPRIQSDYTGERSNLIPISGHRASPNPVAMETRSDNRQSVPVQFQYFLPTYPPSAYPLAAHTYTPITSSVSTIRQYPVSAQAPNSAITAQTGVGVASTVHLNPMQLMTVDASHARHIQGIQPAPISAQGIQPAPISAQGIQPAPIGTQGLHPAAPIGTQGLQPAPINAQQPQTETKTSAVVLADGATIVANPISNTFNAAPAATTVVQTHSQSASASAPAQGSSPRPNTSDLCSLVLEEKKAMLQEIANQKGVSCRAQGWKVHLCAAQLLQLTNLEHDVYERLTSLQEGIIPKKKAATDDDLHRINELIQGNMQRCKLVMDQISEARDSMLKVLDHKERVLKLLNKNGTVKKVSKLKRKEKV
uniref:Sin3A associated protein 130 n=1 Tax=Terrapene triunguis TaxID=2587831 RepID=A0A674IVQ4_9SAUR